MVTNYDTIARQYQRAKLQPWRTHLEAFTLLELIGEIDGQHVVDVACGAGFYTRMLRARGATTVVGVDLSPKMIELARAEETARPLGIKYRVGNGRDLAMENPVDLVVAAYLLNYARDTGELAALCGGIARCLKPGGRFVTVNSNPALNFSTAPSYRDYGFETSVSGPFGEGAPIRWEFHLDDGPFSIENYYLDVARHDEALRAAGFQSVRWHRPRLSPEGESLFGAEFWSTFQRHPPIAFIECVK
jgi:ubiquinone/menaquinone biosynthesis C-methylase UbiE